MRLVLADPAETFLVEVDGRDRRAAEKLVWKLLGLPVGTSMAEVYKGYPETVLAWIAWHAATRGGLLALPFRDVEPRILEVTQEDEDDDEEANPIGDPTEAGTSVA